MTIENVSLARLRPTEAYLCQASLDFLSHDATAAQKPLEVVLDEEDRYLLMDGHNRAFLAYQKGKTMVRAEVHDAANTPTGYGLPGFLVPDRERCKSLGVNAISDLTARILPTRKDVIAYQSNQQHT